MGLDTLNMLDFKPCPLRSLVSDISQSAAVNQSKSTFRTIVQK